MTLYIRSLYYGSINYTRYDGYDEATVQNLMSEIGHQNIEFIDEATYEIERPHLII